MSEHFNPFAHGDPDRIAAAVLALIPSAELAHPAHLIGTTGKGKSGLTEAQALRLVLQGTDDCLACWSFPTTHEWLQALNCGAEPDDCWRDVVDVEHVDGGILVQAYVQGCSAHCACRSLQERYPLLTIELQTPACPSTSVRKLLS